MKHIFTALFAVSCITVDVKDDDDDDNNWVDDDGWSSEEDDPAYNADEDGDDDGGGDGSSDDGGDDDGSGDDGSGDDGGSSGGDVMSSDPGCDMTGALCYSFDGALWASQDVNGFCSDISAGAEAEGAPPMSFLDDGCPSGAASACSGVLMGADADGNPVSGSDVTLYFYSAFPEAEASSSCDDAGGDFSTL